ncbi:50S ribosomal protein L18 [Candidatus Bathyarchaeota archaeon]|nr:50S ribosomal protein L18 [Candidatus Bathyarchaeota archaeon]
MTRNVNYVAFRRRRKGLTDYHTRKRMITSNLPRLVVRTSLKHTFIQLVKAKVNGDSTLASAHSRELSKKHGWKAHQGNVPSAYLTGFLAGHRILKKDVKKAILDIGLQHATPGAKVFAALKGVVDSGIDVPYGESTLPSEERIRGEHISDYAEKLGETDPETYKKRFSRYLAVGLKPSELSKHFIETKEKIAKAFKG